MKEKHKSEILSIIKVFEDEKIRIISMLIKEHKFIYVKSQKDSSVIVELPIHEVYDGKIVCFEDKIERIFPIVMIGRTVSLTREDFEANENGIQKIKDSMSDYYMLINLPSVNQKFHPPKELGGKYHK